MICLLTSWFQTSAFPVQSQLILKSDPTLLSIEMRWGGFNVFLDQFLGEEQQNNEFTRQHSTPSVLRSELIIVRTSCSQLFSTKIFWSGAPANCFGAKMWTRCNAFAADFGAWGQIWSCHFDFAATLLDCEPANHLLLTRAGSNIQRGLGHLVCLVSVA